MASINKEHFDKEIQMQRGRCKPTIFMVEGKRAKQTRQRILCNDISKLYCQYITF
jgi:hypothetical protein